jgi:hypothetical protein
METYLRAAVEPHERRRTELMDKIVAYNKEDLAVTWAVFQWLRSKKG